MSKAFSKILLLVVFLIFNNQNISFSAEEYENINIPCEVKECNPKLGATSTRWYKGDKTKPVIFHYAGGASTYLSLDFISVPVSLLKGKFDIVMVASPIAISAKNSTGFPKGSYNKYAVYRMKQVAEYYKKKFNRPIWLTGISAGGPRMIGTLIGNEKNRPSDIYAGLVFASPYLARVYRKDGKLTGEFAYNIKVKDIKYKMNLPILVVQHARDHKAAQHPDKQKWFTEQLAKRNSGVTELKLLTEGDPKITDDDGGHHWFIYNKPEVARVISKFILDNTK
jgi:hypothetical protein